MDGAKYTALVVTLIMAPFFLASSLIRIGFVNLLSILLFSILTWKFFSVSYFSSFLITFFVFSVTGLILSYKLELEAITTFFNTQYGAYKFGKLIVNYREQNEKIYVSPVISMNYNKYRVIEFGTWRFNPTNYRDITGFLVITNEGELVKEKEKISQLVNLYLFWRRLYFDSALAKLIRTSNKPFLKWNLKFDQEIKKSIEKRQLSQYSQFIKDRGFIDILKKLDDEVIEQYPLITKKLQTSLEISDRLYDLFLYPSKEFYYDFFNKLDTIAKMSEEENKIWSKRLNTWESLHKYYNIKIESMQEPKFKWVFRGVLGDLIDFMLKQQTIPIGGATIVGLTIEGGKKLTKETSKYINKALVYHMMGIDAIKRNIEYNKSLKRIYDEYKQILSSNNIDKVRNFSSKV